MKSNNIHNKDYLRSITVDSLYNHHDSSNKSKAHLLNKLNMYCHMCLAYIYYLKDPKSN